MCSLTTCVWSALRLKWMSQLPYLWNHGSTFTRRSIVSARLRKLSLLMVFHFRPPVNDSKLALTPNFGRKDGMPMASSRVVHEICTDSDVSTLEYENRAVDHMTWDVKGAVQKSDSGLVDGAEKGSVKDVKTVCSSRSDLFLHVFTWVYLGFCRIPAHNTEIVVGVKPVTLNSL